MNPRAERLEAQLQWPMLIAALLVLPSLAIEQSSVDEPWDTVAVVLNWIAWTAFVIEAVLMLRVVDDRWTWIRGHPLEVAIVLLTAPVLPASLQAARLFRVLRLLRLVRAALLVRRLLTTEGVRDAAVLAALTVLGGGAAYAAAEKTGPDGQALSAWDGVWWAITTVTTVGYGDQYPRTDVGRVIAIAVMLAGIGFVAILTAAAADRFMRASAAAERERDELRERLDEVVNRLDAVERR